VIADDGIRGAKADVAAGLQGVHAGIQLVGARLELRSGFV
jgi:hypothetical protein